MGGVPDRLVAEDNRRPRLHSAELRAVRRRCTSSRRPPAHAEYLGHPAGTLHRGAEERRAGRLADPELDHRPRAGLHRSRPRDHRRPSDRCAAQARDHAQRRISAGRQRAQGLRLRARSPGRRDLHQVPEDAQRGGVRRLHRGRPTVPQLASPDGPARRLRPRPHHRRLSPRRALWRQPADRAEEGRKARPRQRAMSTDEIIRDREELAEQIRALEGAAGRWRRATASTSQVPARNAREAVQWLYFGYLAGVKEQNGAAMSLGSHLDLPRHLLRARPGGGRADRAAGAGDHRRLRHQASHRPLSAHARIR